MTDPIRVYIHKSVGKHSGMFRNLVQAINEAAAKVGYYAKTDKTDDGWLAWYEFETEEAAVLFKLTYL